jgi:hypothetical protein
MSNGLSNKRKVFGQIKRESCKITNRKAVVNRAETGDKLKRKRLNDNAPRNSLCFSFFLQEAAEFGGQGRQGPFI